MAKRVPKLPHGDGRRRIRRHFGAASNYGQDFTLYFPNHQQPMSADEFLKHFRFTRADIPRLRRALRVPAVVWHGDGCRIDGEEALLIFLKRMAYACRWVDLEFFFGRCEGYLSTVCSAVLDIIYPFAYHLLHEFDHRSMRKWAHTFAKAFRDVGCPIHNMVGCIDGTFREFCRPSIDGYAGPAQRRQYSGHHGGHGNNHQGVETPDGIRREMHGPFNGPTNDKKMLRESAILRRMARFLPGFCLFGDKGYHLHNIALQTMIAGDPRNLTADELAFNDFMSKMRIAVEWSFGKVVQNWAFVDFYKNQKLYKQPVAKYWFAAVLLTNCHSCLYSNQTSMYFGVPTPDLEDYLAGAY